MFSGGEEEDRTPDLCIANAALSQLSYSPNEGKILADFEAARSTERYREVFAMRLIEAGHPAVRVHPETGGAPDQRLRAAKARDAPSDGTGRRVCQGGWVAQPGPLALSGRCSGGRRYNGKLIEFLLKAIDHP